MASISGNGANGYHKFTLSVTQKSQSVANNTSTIEFAFKISPIQTSWNWEQWGTSISYTVTINGTSYSGSIPNYDGYSTVTLKSGTQTINHSTDGTKKIDYSFSVTDNAGQYYTCGNASGSGSMALTTIPRATTPTLSASSVIMGKSVTITIKPANSTFKHKIRYKFGSLTGQTSGLSVGADFTAKGDVTVTFTPPTSLGKQIPNDPDGTCTIYCYTYNSSGTQIGNTTTKTLKLNVPDYTPLGSITITGNKLLKGTTYVQGKSTITGTITASSSYGASIKSIKSTVKNADGTVDGKTYTANPFTTSALSKGTKTVSVTITDTREKTYTFSPSSNIVVYEYANPYITTFKVERQTDGTTVVATLTAGVSPINNQNARTFEVILNGVAQTISLPLATTYTVTNGSTTFTNVPTDKTLTATANVSDMYTTVSKNATLPTVEVTLDFLADGKGIAMGKVAETTDTFEVAWKTKLNKAAEITDGALATLTLKRNHTYNGSAVKFQNDTGVLGFVGMYGNAVDRPLRRWTSDAGTSYIVLDTGNVGAYVEEQGISNEWNYLKWSNGRSEAWRKVELGDVALTSSLVGGVYSNTSYNARGLTLPTGVFATIPLAFANVYSNGYTHCQVASATNTQIVYRLWSPYSATVTGVIVSLYVVGKWK